MCPSQSVLGSLRVPKGGLFLNFVAPNTDSTLWLTGVLFRWGPFQSIMAFNPLDPSCTCSVSFPYNVDKMSFGVVPGQFFPYLGLIRFQLVLVVVVDFCCDGGVSCHQLFPLDHSQR